MEKTGIIMTTIKGSTSSAVEVIAVDPEALCCPRCHQLLAPPVMQCGAGHLICSSCHDTLPDKTKCVSCFTFIKSFTATSYSRNNAVEGILRFVRVDCPSANHGCTAMKMLYHEKTCPGIAHSGGLPRWVVKMGPCGGGCGDTRDMDVRGVDRIVKVFVWHGFTFALDAMSVLYERDGRQERTDVWGLPTSETERSRGSECSEICLEDNEFLTCLKGHVDDDMVTALTFVSNRRTYGPYGMEEGEPFELPAAGGRIIGFHGRSDSYLNALGTYVKMAI